MTARGGQQRGELGPVALAEGLAHLQQGLVAAVLRHGQRRCQGDRRGSDERCQNLRQQLHPGIM
jgi:hypothetical protein